ncbi:ABC transporter permease [Crenobacter oryzisoli]|uniref:ABC transporter permease n=1 Tax=Crenobacter oryzisoli TaxID=3056844 RepID=UPI003F4992DD
MGGALDSRGAQGRAVIGRFDPKRASLTLLPLAFLAVVVVAPLARLLAEGWDHLSANILTDAYLRWRIVWSLIQAAVTCVLTLLLGVPLAWALARFDFAGRTLVLRLLMLPFVMPTLVAGLGVLALAGPHGVLPINGQDTPWLLLYGNLFYNLPLVLRAGMDGFAAVPASRLAAARSLGATPWRAFWRVEWPAVRPWLASALCLVFLYCFSGFGLALLLGGQRYATVDVEIYSLVAYELNLGDAGALALAMMAITGAAALGYAWVEKRLAAPGRVEPIAPRRPATLAEWAWLAVALAMLIAFSGAPLLAVLGRALTAGPEAWAVLIEPDTLAALANSGRFSLIALALASVLGIAHALIASRSLWLRGAVFLPFVVSPVCVAFGLLLLYPSWTASLALLLSAYALFAYPFIAKAIAAALDALPTSQPQAAQSLGATPWRAFWRVSWPWLLPAFRRGLAFAAATTVGEFAVTLFLSRPEWMTLTTLIYQRLGRPGPANLDAALVLSALLMLFALAAFVLIEWPTPLERARRALATRPPAATELPHA